ncbi:MAG: preprotein translocase subunit SecA [bacterium]
MEWIIKKIIGTRNERTIKSIRHIVRRINELEAEYQKLSDDQVRAKTAEFKDRIAAQYASGLTKKQDELLNALSNAIDERERTNVKRMLKALNAEVLDPILPEAFAVAKNACRRLVGLNYQVCNHDASWNMVPFDVQLIGGILLHQGKIAEMATGEGKTLVATLPVYLNALAGRGVHMVTVNDYLARRDAQWMAPLYDFLGITVGCIQNHMEPEDRREQYSRDVTYGTNSEFGFDYLRDNGLARQPVEQVQRGYNFAIIDEADNILIDEARTPLIISGAVSGPGSETSQVYMELKPRVERLVRMQRDICNGLMSKAKELIEKGNAKEAEPYLYQVRHGMPKHKQFMHMLEEPSTRKLLEHIENMMLTDMHKEEARELREELYFTIDEKGHDASLTEKGCEALNPSDPDTFVLPDLGTEMAEIDGNTSMTEAEKSHKRLEVQTIFADKSDKVHIVDQLIRAYCIYERDVEYVVQDNRVLIVDEFTGRILPGRRWSDGLHQAVEAKEGVKIERESQTLATITIQNYFRMYQKLGGMTGTAETEASELHQTYGLDVVVVPTNRPVRRIDNHDQIFKTQREKFKAVISDIADCHGRGQPVLVGTVSVDTSELLSRMLRREKIPHNVLNAKQHEMEAEIVARAGQPGSVTIATNMAGRGTDIKLGEGVVYVDRATITSGASLDSPYQGTTLRKMLVEKPCGLYVIGSERHEARRIDRQLRGRCARQGDPGASRFYVSLEDDLMRLFGSDRIAGILGRLGLEEGQVLEHRWLNRSIETAQKRVEQQNFSIRKRTLEYDDVMNKQREIVYRLRGDIVRSPVVRESLYDMIYDAISARAEGISADDSSTVDKFIEWVRIAFPIAVQTKEFAAATMTVDAIADRVFDQVKAAYELKMKSEDPGSINDVERHVMLRAIDVRWQDFLRSMDSLREGVGLRAYGQRDPLVEYKREAYDMFETLMNDIKDDVASQVFRTSTSAEAFGKFISALPQTLIHDEVSILGSRGLARTQKPPQGEESAPASDRGEDEVMRALEPVRRDVPKVGRNDACPCGSGRKYKKCCGE